MVEVKEEESKEREKKRTERERERERERTEDDKRSRQHTIEYTVHYHTVVLPRLFGRSYCTRCGYYEKKSARNRRILLEGLLVKVVVEVKPTRMISRMLARILEETPQ